MKTAHSSSDVPKTPHFAIVVFSSVHVDGDERSRTNPGHGYPAHDISTAEYRYTMDRAEWEREVGRMHADGYSRGRYVALEASPAAVTVE